MARRIRRVGICGYCEGEFSAAGVTRRLSACSRRKSALAEADQGAGRNVSLYHLCAQDEWRKDFSGSTWKSPGPRHSRAWTIT